MRRTIFQEGDPGDGLYVILEGSVQISAIVGQSERRVLTQFGPGDFFGEVALMKGTRRTATRTDDGEASRPIPVIAPPRSGIERAREVTALRGRSGTSAA